MAKKMNRWQMSRKMLADEWRWFRSHGASLSKYIERYGRGTDPEPIRYGEGGEAIFAADVEALKRKLNNAVDRCTSAAGRHRIPRFMIDENGKIYRRV